MSLPLTVTSRKYFTINYQKTITNMTGNWFAITKKKKKIS